MKILVIALSGIGDALMFTPALTKLKQDLPDAEIDALVMFSGARDLYERLPEVNKVYYYNFLKASPTEVFEYVLRFRNKYNATISVYPSNRKEYNGISYIIGAKKRLGVRYLRKDTPNLGFLNNLTITENDELHNVEENIKLVEKLTGKAGGDIAPLSFPLTRGDKEYAENYLSGLGITDSDAVIGFHAGCSTLKNHINRRWAPERFAELANKLITEMNAKVLLFGGPEETELKQNIIESVNSTNIIEVVTDNLPQSAAVMKRCSVFVSNDSGLMHIASAMGIKVAAIIGPTNTNYIYPWKTEHKIVSLNLECAPCFYYSPRPLICARTDVKYKCVKEIGVDMVYKAVTDLLSS